jgi:nitrate reductase gamma subunit
MLKLGGYINILIAIGHIVGLIWADKMFEMTGIENEMKELAQIHSSLPYLLTIFVGIIFFIFGL